MEERRTGHVWAVIQEWMDSIPYPPSQSRLAARLGVSKSALSQWKYGDAFPPPATVARIAEELGVPQERVLDAFLRDQGYRVDRPGSVDKQRGA